MATKKSGETQVKGVSEALAAVKGGGAKKSTTKKAPAKKASAKKSSTKKASTKKAPAKKASAKKSSTKKASAKKKAPEKVSSGQAGPPLDLPLEKVNAKERRVLTALNGSGSGTREIFGIVDLANACWKSKANAQANSWVRNSLRRLVRSGLVEKVERGKFRISEAGRKRLSRAEAA